MVERGGQVAVKPSPALGQALVGELTELAFACGKGDLTVDESLDAFSTLLDQLAPAATGRRTAKR